MAYVWSKRLSKEHNGYYCVKAKDLIIAGEEFVKKAQNDNFKQLVIGSQDKKIKDKRLNKSYVVICKGPMKGLKARVISANDINVNLEICINGKKVILPRGEVMEIRDPTQPLYSREMDVAPLSFEAAGKEDIPMNEDNGTPKHYAEDDSKNRIIVLLIQMMIGELSSKVKTKTQYQNGTIDPLTLKFYI